MLLSVIHFYCYKLQRGSVKPVSHRVSVVGQVIQLSCAACCANFFDIGLDFLAVLNSDCRRMDSTTGTWAASMNIRGQIAHHSTSFCGLLGICLADTVPIKIKRWTDFLQPEGSRSWAGYPWRLLALVWKIFPELWQVLPLALKQAIKNCAGWL